MARLQLFGVSYETSLLWQYAILIYSMKKFAIFIPLWNIWNKHFSMWHLFPMASICRSQKPWSGNKFEEFRKQGSRRIINQYCRKCYLWNLDKHVEISIRNQVSQQLSQLSKRQPISHNEEGKKGSLISFRLKRLN